MRAKRRERQQAIDLRKMGLSYSEIQAKVPVSQASLSLWLRGVELHPIQRRRLAERKLTGQRFAAQKVHEQRLARVANTLLDAKSEAEQLLNAQRRTMADRHCSLLGRGIEAEALEPC